ncbi:MAG: hypothetical protein JJU45_02905 [Acidimicrobiia bacterium]|nr:hypothetical protein [Acidimicrobiia bacterium]
MTDNVGSDHDDRPWPGGGAPLLVWARQLGWLCWAERRLFSLVGAWVCTVEQPSVTTLLAVSSRHHGERSEWWFARLPELRELPAESLVLPPEGPFAAVCDDLEGAEALGDAERLAVLCEVLQPRLLATYEALLAQCDGVADAPVRRTLRQASADLEQDVADATTLLGCIGTRGTDDSAVVAAVEALQRRFGALGGLLPLGTDSAAAE